MPQPVSLNNLELLLLPERAVWWQAERTLIVTDTHFGKGESFRHGGLPIPTGSLASDLARLSQLVRDYQPQRLLHLGDFYHARQGVTDRVRQQLNQWRTQHVHLSIVLVAGNHDRHAGKPAPELEIQVVDSGCQIGSLLAHHQPPGRVPAGSLAVAGHLHPGIVIKDRLDRLRLPCFHYRRNCLVLPAFSEFTGLADIKPSAKSRQWAIADSVRELT